MPVVNPKKSAGKSTARSAITNGKLGEMDGRSVWARRFRDLIAAYSADISDDVDSIAETTKAIIRRAAALTVELERAEVGFAEMGEADADALRNYQTTANTLRRLIDGLPLKVSVKEAKEIERAIEGGRVIQGVMDKFTVADWALGVGRKQATYDLARRVYYAIERAKETGEPVPPSVAELAVDLCLAQYADHLEADSDGAKETNLKLLDGGLL